MTIGIAHPVTLGPPPSEPICRSPEDPTQSCAYAGTCHEVRQRLMHYHGMRGTACWFFQQQLDRVAAATPEPINDGTQVRESEVAP